MITVIHPDNGKRSYAINDQGRKVLGSGYYTGRFKPNFPVPAIRECPWCQSKHVGHSHFICEDELIVPN